MLVGQGSGLFSLKCRKERSELLRMIAASSPNKKDNIV